ncbi:MAG TPA: hypothetical protein VK975_05905 [Acidimicrobiales bacterium]|nr:hypothetical protein [Acidimicrobiales bacterium]
MLILPLLPELYDDELDVVEERERATKGRAVILDRLAELGGQGGPEEEPVEAVAAEPEPAVAGDEDDEDDEDDEEFFPIADYDELTVGEILPLLPELYDDELDVVEERERAIKGRDEVIARIEELRGTAPAPDEVGDEPAWEVPDEGWVDEVAEVEDTVREPQFPIPDYDRLRVPEIRAALADLSEEELEQVRQREVASANRTMVLAAIHRELGIAAPVPAKKAPAKRTSAKKVAAKTAPATVPTKKAPAKKVAAKKVTAKNVPATKAPATKARATTVVPPIKAPAKKKAAAAKVPAKKATTVQKVAPAKKASATTKATTKKVVAKKVAAKKAPGTRRATPRP